MCQDSRHISAVLLVLGCEHRTPCIDTLPNELHPPALAFLLNLQNQCEPLYFISAIFPSHILPKLGAVDAICKSQATVGVRGQPRQHRHIADAMMSGLEHDF